MHSDQYMRLLEPYCREYYIMLVTSTVEPQKSAKFNFFKFDIRISTGVMVLGVSSYNNKLISSMFHLGC